MEGDIAVLVSPKFFDTTHGKMGCRDCHNGTKFAKTRKEAHEGMEPLPSSKYAESVCAPCHKQITDTFAKTLHAETRGVSSTKVGLVLKRVKDGNRKAVDAGMNNNCNTCHVSGCGDCHVTRPQFNDGGFTQGHVFSKTPNSLNNCMGCHGSRIEKEYTGKGEGTMSTLQADVHWTSSAMQCAECHTKEWIHGGDVYDERYDAPKAPKCEKCHPNNAAFMEEPMHARHAVAGTGSSYLQCQVCHAQEYNNCSSCHVALDDKKLPFFTTESSGFDFNIGRNYDKSDKKPWDFIVVRHVPVDKDTFKFYGENGIDDLAAVPTWKYATPHSILKSTIQTANGCNSCHGVDKLFLTSEDMKGLDPDEVKANQPVIVTGAPPAREGR